MIAQIELSDSQRNDDLHWRLAQATVEAMRTRLDSHLYKQGLRICEDREDTIQEKLPKLKTAFDANCPLCETDLTPYKPQLMRAEAVLPRVSSLVWKILEQARCDFLKRPANRLRCAGSSCKDFIEARAKPESVDVRGLLEALSKKDRRIINLLLAGENQKSIACIVGVDPSTISRRIERIRQAIAED